jgi:hypothetical protein
LSSQPNPLHSVTGTIDTSSLSDRFKLFTCC